MAFTASDWGQGQLLTGLSPSASITGFTAVITKDNLPTSALDGGLLSCLNGGGDWRFSTDIDGVNQLPVDIITCATSATPANTEFVSEIRFDTYSSGAREVYAFWNKAGESQPLPSAAFGSEAVYADYEVVIRANETGTNGVFADSTGNGHGTTKRVGGTLNTTTAGNQLGLSWPNFTEDQTLSITNSSALINNTAFTLSCWVNADVVNVSVGVLSSRYDGATDSGTIRVDGVALTQGNGSFNVANGAPVLAGATTYLKAKQNTSSLQSVQNGSVVDTELSPDDAESINNLITANTFMISGYFDESQGRRLNGRAGDFRIKRAKDSDSLDDMEYQNKSDPATFWTAGAVFVPSGGANTSDIACTISPPTFSINSTNTAPAINSADIAYSVGSPLFTVNSTVLSPSFNSDVSFSITAPTFTSTGTVVNPAGATVSFTIDAPTFSANSTVAPPIFTSNIDFDISAPVFSIDANNGVVQRISNIDFTAPAPTFSADSTITIPDIEGDIAFSVSPPLFSVIAGTDADVYYYAYGTQLALPTISRLITLSTKTRQVRI